MSAIYLDAYRRKRDAAVGAISVDEAIDICLRHPEALTSWERRFLTDIRGWPHRSIGQWMTLQQIFDRLSGESGGVA
jgi:hypothetical protein